MAGEQAGANHSAVCDFTIWTGVDRPSKPSKPPLVDITERNDGTDCQANK